MINGDFKCAIECKFHKHEQYDEMEKICDAFLGQKGKSLIQLYSCCRIKSSHETQHIMIRRTRKSKYKGNQKVQNYAKLLLLMSKDKRDAIIKLSLYLVEHYRYNYKL